MPLKHLPIDDACDSIVATIREHQVVIVAGDTGCGKTTRLPRFCLQAGLGTDRLIGCTQPRRIAARSMADRVAQEMQESGHDPALVGCTVRFQDRTTKKTRIRFMTDGILLAELQKDRTLGRYDAIILDEIHERTLNIDLLVGAIKQLLPRRPDLKCILSSATMESERFSAFFDNAPLIEVTGRRYPVEIQYRPLDSFDLEEGGSHVEAAAAMVHECIRRGQRDDTLIFMPTEKDIVDTVELLERDLAGQCAILPLFGRLPMARQKEVFRPAGKMKIVVATNVAETSITVDGIKTVIDTGLARMNIYSLRSRTTTLPVMPVSQASCRQRAGRAGRTAAGTCIRLFSTTDFDNRPEYTRPEILRSNLAEVLLKMAAAGMGRPEDFPFLDPPLARGIADARRLLEELGALSARGRLTRTGRIMARLPLDPCISRILIEASQRNVLREATIIAAALSVQDPRIVPADERNQARQKHARFKADNSDFLSFLVLWEHVTGQSSRSALRRFCRSHYLSFQRLRDWIDIHHQITTILRENRTRHAKAHRAAGGRHDRPGDVDDLLAKNLHCSILAGFLRFVAVKRASTTKKKDGAPYIGTHNRDVWIHPGSWQKKTTAEWIVAAEVVRTSKTFARTVAAIEPQWLEEVGGHLMKKSYTDPHWSKKRGRAVAAMQMTLFGLPVVRRRLVNCAEISEEYRRTARTLFIHHGLVEGELFRDFLFLTKNQALTQTLLEKEERLRQRGYVADSEAQAAFYEQRLPPDIHDVAGLVRFLADRKQALSLEMTAADLQIKAPDDEDMRGFPETVVASDMRIPFQYRFAPGETDDGVTALLSHDSLERLDPHFFEWTVPGLLQEKIALLLKALPKTLRRPLVPLQHTATLLYEAVRDRMFQGSLLAALARELHDRFNITVTRDTWKTDTLPPHLTMHIAVTDAAGEIMARGDDPSELFRQLPKKPTSRRGLAGLKKKWERQGVVGWDFAALPATLALADGSYAYPGLVAHDSGKSVAIRLFPDEKQARYATRQGLVVLYGLAFRALAATLKKSCTKQEKAAWHLFSTCTSIDSHFQNTLYSYVMEELFQCRDGILPDKKTFDRRIDGVRENNMLIEGEKIAGTVLEALEEIAATRGEIDRFRTMAPRGRTTDERFQWYDDCLATWMPPTILATHSLTDLNHGRRMLRALHIRLQRAHSDPGKDAEKNAVYQRYRKRLQSAAGQPAGRQKQEAVKEYAGMVDELFISLFAQEMGTRCKVSPKKLDKKWQEIQLL